MRPKPKGWKRKYDWWVPTRADFRPDILEFLRLHHGQHVQMFPMVTAMAKPIKDRHERIGVRRKILMDIADLVREDKVVRYRKKHGNRRTLWNVLRINEKEV